MGINTLNTMSCQNFEHIVTSTYVLILCFISKDFVYIKYLIKGILIHEDASHSVKIIYVSFDSNGVYL